MISKTRIQTAYASRYLQQLCKHFSHKILTDFNKIKGRIEFPMGNCALTAEDNILTMHVTSEDDASLEKLQDICERHLIRFAFREELKISWQRYN